MAPVLLLVESMRTTVILSLALAACGPQLLDEEDADGTDLSGESLESLQTLRPPKQGPFGADPHAIVDGDTLHVYTTSHHGLNIPHFSGASPTDLGSLGAPTEALPNAERGDRLAAGVWAPTVRRAGDHFAMWYSGGLQGTDDKCLWRAVSDRPEGPFRRVGQGNPICPDPHWNIDPYLVRTGTGFWLYAKVSGKLQRRQLERDGLTFAARSSWAVVLGGTEAWEQGQTQNVPLVENPAPVRLAKPDGSQRWLLFYASNSWATRDYATGYADCGNGTQPGACVKESKAKPWLSRHDAIAPRGPGGAAFFNHGGKAYMILHGWANPCNLAGDTCHSKDPGCPAGGENNDCRFENPGGRSLYLYRVGLNANGNPVAQPL